MLSFNESKVVECVKSICDNTQCLTCGKLIGPCVRFQCGHSMCKGCGEEAGECVFCVTSVNDSYVLDKPQTDRLNNATNLLTTFQDTFKVNVYQRQRFSDYLKLEKQVFPGCIQAPCPYFNKKKSLNISRSDKENFNKSFFLGENICLETVKMKKSHQYVQNWLNDHEDIPQSLPRKPFGDININTQSLSNKEKKNVSTFNRVTTKVNSKIATSKKKSNIKFKKSPSLLKGFVKTNASNHDQSKLEKIVGMETSDECLMRKKCDRDESGIVIDDGPMVVDDSPIVVEGTQFDKDNLAWLAVLKRAEQDEYKKKEFLSKHTLQSRDIEKSLGNLKNISPTNRTENSIDMDESGISIKKPVSFLRKSALFELCHLCTQDISRHHNSHPEIDESKDISITINNSAFVTTIKLMHCTPSDTEVLSRSTVAIQTDELTETVQNKIAIDYENTNKQKRKNVLMDEIIPTKTIKPNITQSLDIFTTDKSIEHKYQSNCDKDATKQNVCNDSIKQSKNVIIEDSDTDSNSSPNTVQEVIADVHRSSAPENVQFGILRTLPETSYHQRSKLPIRGHTPNSSDSSDKENLDPNRNKQAKFGKKFKNKK